MQGPQLRGRALLIFVSFPSFDLSLGFLISHKAVRAELLAMSQLPGELCNNGSRQEAGRRGAGLSPASPPDRTALAGLIG
jgi:hypothetical protein